MIKFENDYSSVIPISTEQLTEEVMSLVWMNQGDREKSRGMGHQRDLSSMERLPPVIILFCLRIFECSSINCSRWQCIWKSKHLGQIWMMHDAWSWSDFCSRNSEVYRYTEKVRNNFCYRLFECLNIQIKSFHFWFCFIRFDLWLFSIRKLGMSLKYSENKQTRLICQRPFMAEILNIFFSSYRKQYRFRTLTIWHSEAYEKLKFSFGCDQHFWYTFLM
jgi:hypothetical protein